MTTRITFPAGSATASNRLYSRELARVLRRHGSCDTLGLMLTDSSARCVRPKQDQTRPARGDVRGFTLIELLIVVIIVGLLATIAIPKFASTKEKAYDATAVSDVRNAMVALESYFADNYTYPATIGDANFQPSPGVTFTQWQVETQDGLLSVHLHVEHARSSSYYHAHYPAESDIEKRNK